MAAEGQRQIGGLAAALLAFNGVVGAGIFVLPGLVARDFGAFGPWLFPLFGLLMLVVVVPLAAVSARFEVSGGPQAYVSQAFGPFAGFQAGWLFTVAKVTALAANATVFASYAVGLFPGLDGQVHKSLIVGLLLLGLGTANWLGLKGAIRLLEWSSLLKAAPLLLFAGAGLALFWRELPPPGPLPPLSALEASALVIFYAFVGFENAMVAAGETRNARRNIPKALVRIVAATAVFYFLIQLAFTAVAPEASADAPMIAFGAAIAGGAGAVAMTLIALVSLTGNLHGNLLTTPYLLKAMATAGQLPGWFGKSSARYGTPANALWFFTFAALALALSGGFVVLAVLGTVARLLLFLMIYAALPRLRAQAGERALPPAGLVVAILLGSAVSLWALAQNEARAWWLLAACLAVGGLLYAMARRR
ncbi:MAG: APC family permease [Sandaracinobacteroides sp.]